MIISSVTVDSGENNPPHHGRPLLAILGERPEPDVLEALMRPYLDDPPWANKRVRLAGYALGGNYRGWLTPKPNVEVLRGELLPEHDRALHCDGVDAVRICDLQTAELCWKYWRGRSFGSSIRAHRCEVLVARPYAQDEPPGTALEAGDYDNPWRDYSTEHKDRPHARWLKINEGSCDDKRIPALIDQVPSSCWLAVIDCW